MGKKKSECTPEEWEKELERKRRNYQEKKEQYREYYATSSRWRAKQLLRGYRDQDNERFGGGTDLTSEWIDNNILSQPCLYCGESNWKKLGCDRIDNEMPHTYDNVVPCCFDCNCKRHRKDIDVFLNSTLD